MAMHHWIIGTAAFLQTISAANAFAVPTTSFMTQSKMPAISRTRKNGQGASTHLSATNGGDGDAAAGGSATATENDIRSFLNQCTIQSFMFLLRSTRDPHTIRWIDNFTRPVVDQDYLDAWNVEVELGDGSSYVSSDDAVPSELLRYHGLGAMNMTVFPTWESYFRDLLKENETVLVVETCDPRFPKFEIDVNPASLCSRILSVREQISGEFANDLGTLAGMSRDTYYSYWRQSEMMRAEGMADDDDNSGDNDSDAGDSTSEGFERQSLMFLDWYPDFDEQAAPSPLRKGNYDLLVLMCTQESIHRLIRDGVKVADETEAQVKDNTMFLRQFYWERLPTHFTGNLRYGRADDFLEELFLVSFNITSSENSASLVDPLVIAEAILMERERVALEWKEVAEQSPREHMEIRKLQLNKMMGL